MFVLLVPNGNDEPPTLDGDDHPHVKLEEQAKSDKKSECFRPYLCLKYLRV